MEKIVKKVVLVNRIGQTEASDTEVKTYAEMLSNELKIKAVFGKDGEKGFDGAITNLCMQTYLCNCDFRKRKNKKGIEYGWDVAVYSSVEHIYGYDYVTSCYKEEPTESWNRIVEYMHETYPIATDKQIRKLLR